MNPIPRITPRRHTLQIDGSRPLHQNAIETIADGQIFDDHASGTIDDDGRLAPVPALEEGRPLPIQSQAVYGNDHSFLAPGVARLDLSHLGRYKPLVPRR